MSKNTVHATRYVMVSGNSFLENALTESAGGVKRKSPTKSPKPMASKLGPQPKNHAEKAVATMKVVYAINVDGSPAWRKGCNIIRTTNATMTARRAAM